MKNFTATFFIQLLFLFHQNTQAQNKPVKTWANAKWIALEQLKDSMKVVPAVHGSGNKLGNKGLKRSIVPEFRKEFYSKENIEHASINICGLGHYELYLNSEKVGNRFLSPGWSNYLKRCLYNTYDITKKLKTGENAIGVLVGNGFFNVNRERYRKLVVAYGYPRLIFNITITYKNGWVENIVSDENCRVIQSPITFSSIYGGEDYDARLEQKDWNKIGFDDSKWQDPVILHDSIGQLEPEKDYPLKVMQTFITPKISTSKTGKIIYDFGQNASGIIALKVKGNKGTQIRIRPAELLNSKGDITQRSSGGPYELNYTLSGNGVEEWQPRFTYYGFRYAEVEIVEPENATKKTKVTELKMLHTRNSSPTVGDFSCSNTLFNQIFDLINWGIKSNMASVATDCPHREKLGWLEQTYLIGPSMHFNFDIHKLYSKIVTDMMDSQLDNGLVPDIAPEYVHFNSGFRDSPEWGSAAVIIPWQLYKWYGDKEVLQKAYPMMKRYVAYLQGKAANHILEHGLGDWYDLGKKPPGEAQLTPKAVTATSIYFYDLLLISKIAQLFDFDIDSAKFNNEAKKVQEAFLNKFYKANTGIVSTGSQTAFAMPLYTGIIPVADREYVFNNLVQSIVNNDYALTSGDIGYHFLVCVLNENGRSDILYKMNNRTDRPGYGYQLAKGATALTESWEALPESSNNHMMLGHLMEWFYSGLGGIYQAQNSVSYNNIVIAPKLVGDIKWVKCAYHSIKGKISSEWEIEGNKFSLNVEIPKKVNAKIILPEKYQKATVEVSDLHNQKSVEMKIANGEFYLNSGNYRVLAEIN